MARVWIEDRIGHAAYTHAVARAKQAGRTLPAATACAGTTPTANRR